MNLTELLAALSNLDDAGDVDFDPMQIVGDVKDKVDAIYKVIGRLCSERDRLTEDSRKLAEAARSIERSNQRLLDYLAFAMRSQGFEKLPGATWRVQFQKAPPALEVERDATGDDLIEHPSWVKRTVTYSWVKDEIKSHLAAGGTFALGKIVQSHYLKFYVNKGSAK